MGVERVAAGAIGVTTGGHAGRPLSAASLRLRALVLLGGAVRPGELSRAIDRSLLDLPVGNGQTVLTLWQAAAEALVESAGLPALPIRVAIDRTSPAPKPAPASPRVPIEIERDPAEFRGTGGVLRDLCVSYDPEDRVLVANAAQILVEPLHDLARDLLSCGGEVSLIGHRDGTPGGLFLVRCSVFSAIGDVGFLDFKEQFLPRMAAGGRDIRVIQRPTATGLPVRTLDGYIAGLRAFQRVQAGGRPIDDPLAEDWAPTFALREPGAAVDPTATIHDSVVLRGAAVGRGAVVVRCVVGPGGVVRPGQTVADRVIAAPARERGGRAA